MPQSNTFAKFLSRIRSGDRDAAEALVREYEPILLREIRLRLTDPRLHRLYDSADICQSVLRSFFVRAAAGQYELSSARDLRHLLVTMAYHKIATKARRLRRPGPERDQVVDSAAELHTLADRHPSVEEKFLNRDLVQAVCSRLPEEERVLAELRGQGYTWAAISDHLGGTAEGRRKQLARALDRVLHEMGLEEPDVMT